MDSANAGLLAGFIISVLQASGYLGVLGLMAIESACLPLPSEIILPPADLTFVEAGEEFNGEGLIPDPAGA